MMQCLMLSDASAALNYNYDPRVTFLFIDAFPLQIGGGYIYVLICFMTDPMKQRANSRSLLCEPLLVDDGHGIEDLDQGKAQGNENWDTLDYESLLSVL